MSFPAAFNLVCIVPDGQAPSCIRADESMGVLKFGRAGGSADVQLPFTFMSGQHASLELARISWTPPGKVELRIQDTSTNGTWVNGERIPAQTWFVLHHGDSISFLNPRGFQQHAAYRVEACESAKRAFTVAGFVEDQHEPAKQSRIAIECSASETASSGSGNVSLLPGECTLERPGCAARHAARRGIPNVPSSPPTKVGPRRPNVPSSPPNSPDMRVHETLGGRRSPGLQELESPWPETWQETEAACRRLGERQGRPFACLECPRSFDSAEALYGHISGKGHVSDEQINRWHEQWGSSQDGASHACKKNAEDPPADKPGLATIDKAPLSVWPESWREAESACREAGEKRGKVFACLECGRLSDSVDALYHHISSKGHVSQEQTQRWNEEWSAGQKAPSSSATVLDNSSAQERRSSLPPGNEETVVWPNTWEEVMAACRKVGEERNRTYGCLVCSRCFDDEAPLYSHVSAKADHAPLEVVQRWNDQWKSG